VLSENPGSLNLLQPSRPVQACTGIALPLPDWLTTAITSVTCQVLRNWKNGKMLKYVAILALKTVKLAGS
jgi:hypothetical protein